MQWTPEEQAEHRKLWVEALRSGKYEQGTGRLRMARTTGSPSFCCLGVACEVSGLGEWSGSALNEYRVPADEYVGLIPRTVTAYFGLSSGMANTDDHGSLWSMNDDGKTFAEIADIIEAEPAGLIAKVEAA